MKLESKEKITSLWLVLIGLNFNGEWMLEKSFPA
jgi:hypothetical protein